VFAKRGLGARETVIRQLEGYRARKPNDTITFERSSVHDDPAPLQERFTMLLNHAEIESILKSLKRVPLYYQGVAQSHTGMVLGGMGGPM
jgi:hypothetical protein